MTIEEMKERRTETENEIRDILTRFSDETKLIVDDIMVRRMDVSRMDGPKEVIYDVVRLDVRL